MKIKSPKINNVLESLIDKTSSKFMFDKMTSKTAEKGDNNDLQW